MHQNRFDFQFGPRLGAAVVRFVAECIDGEDGMGRGYRPPQSIAPRSRQIPTPTPHYSIFTGRMLFLTPNQLRQSTEGAL